MNQKNVNAKEMELRKDKDVINAKKMVAEGGPVALDDQAIADAESVKSTASLKQINRK